MTSHGSPSLPALEEFVAIDAPRRFDKCATLRPSRRLYRQRKQHPGYYLRLVTRAWYAAEIVHTEHWNRYHQHHVERGLNVRIPAIKPVR